MVRLAKGEEFSDLLLFPQAGLEGKRGDGDVDIRGLSEQLGKVLSPAILLMRPAYEHRLHVCDSRQFVACLVTIDFLEMV